MIRLFVALALPDDVAQSLSMLQSGVPGARWSTREQLHLTLRFIGEMDEREASAIDEALAGISAPPFVLQLKGVGSFGGKNPHALWAGVAANDSLMHLQRKIESAIQRLGFPAEQRKYTPHVTLARLRATPPQRVMDYLSDHGLYASPLFEVSAFALFSSQLTPRGSIYVAEGEYPLR
ncbi:MAG: RNA 2',3'-cyclic phosphodiesterase [Alphaproteobacteria bacterium]|nr:RNA 2',3'-cyclic phosphodiesterase [Alphaproteobacteria bacterium]MBV9062750.1 RNA 2',3'-cyclic phosphodiesterase [Alphaproteobacteria bacterium]